MSQLLEDAETRCALVSVLVDAGLGVETVRSLFEMRVRSYVPNPHDVPEENNQAAGRMLVLLDNPERNLHVCNFGWARFRGCDVAFIAKYSPFVEMGAGSGLGPHQRSTCCMCPPHAAIICRLTGVRGLCGREASRTQRAGHHSTGTKAVMIARGAGGYPICCANAVQRSRASTSRLAGPLSRGGGPGRGART